MITAIKMQINLRFRTRDRPKHTKLKSRNSEIFVFSPTDGPKWAPNVRKNRKNLPTARIIIKPIRNYVRFSAEPAAPRRISSTLAHQNCRSKKSNTHICRTSPTALLDCLNASPTENASHHAQFARLKRMLRTTGSRALIDGRTSGF